MGDLGTKNDKLNERMRRLADIDPKLEKDFREQQGIEEQYLIDTDKDINSVGQDR